MSESEVEALNQMANDIHTISQAAEDATTAVAALAEPMEALGEVEPSTSNAAGVIGATGSFQYLYDNAVDGDVIMGSPGEYPEQLNVNAFTRIQPMTEPISEGIRVDGSTELHVDYTRIRPAGTAVANGDLIASDGLSRYNRYVQYDSVGNLTALDGAPEPAPRELNEAPEPQNETEPDGDEGISPPTEEGSNSSVAGAWAQYTTTIPISFSSYGNPMYNFGSVNSKPLPEPKPILNPKRITRRVLNMAEEGWVVQ